MYFEHTPVLADEVIGALNIQKDGIYVDATLGGGGYALKILSELGPCGSLVGIDRDQEAIENFKKVVRNNRSIILVKDNFKNIKRVLDGLKIKEVDGIVFDLGVSTHHLRSASRGFSFSQDGPLDMRMDKDEAVTAKDLVNNAETEVLEKIFRDFGEEKFSRLIARGIISERRKKEIATTSDLVNIINRRVPSKFKKGKIHFATRIFQALRIAVNDELDNLKTALKDSIEVLKKKGRVAVISYHSLEDRIVKNIFKLYAGKCICPREMPECSCEAKLKKLKVVTKKPITPGEAELGVNPKSRSAKLRAAEKI